MILGIIRDCYSILLVTINGVVQESCLAAYQIDIKNCRGRKWPVPSATMQQPLALGLSLDWYSTTMRSPTHPKKCSNCKDATRRRARILRHEMRGEL